MDIRAEWVINKFRINDNNLMDESPIESSANQLKSQESEQSINDFVCTLLPQEGGQSPNDDPSSCFKQIVEFENEESSEEEISFGGSREKDYYPDFDLLGHSIPSPFDGGEFDGEPQEVDNQKENVSPKQMYLATPLKLKLSSTNRSPLQDITPSIRKKEKLIPTSFTYQKNSFLHQTPKTMAESGAKMSSSSRLRVSRM